MLCFRVHRRKLAADETTEISSTEAQYCDDRQSFDTVATNKPRISSSPFTDHTVSPFTIAGKVNTASISPKKSPVPSSVVGIHRTSSGITSARNFPTGRHTGAGSSFMKSDHISRLNFNLVSTTSTSGNLDSATHWLSSFSEVQTPGNDFTSSPQTTGIASPINSIEDDMSPPVLKPKVRRPSHHTPDKSPLVTSSSNDAVELGKPSVGLGQPPGISSSSSVDIELGLSHRDTVSNSSQFSVSVDGDNLDEQALCDWLPVYTKNAKQLSMSRSVGVNHKNSHKISKPTAKEKPSSKSGLRSTKQKVKSPAAEHHDKQQVELDVAFEAACRLPSTVRGQPSLALDTSSKTAKHRSSLDSHKVSCILLTFVLPVYHRPSTTCLFCLVLLPPSSSSCTCSPQSTFLPSYPFPCVP